MDYMPDDNSRYKDVDYWDERYKTEQCYDWLGSFSKFQHLLEEHVKKEDGILILGCGNSSMSSDMYSAGYRSITNIDYSSVCISTMAARHSDCPGMTWHQMDVRQLCFPGASFDVILEKATLDAIMVEEKSPWQVSPQTACFVHQALTEVSTKILRTQCSGLCGDINVRLCSCCLSAALNVGGGFIAYFHSFQENILTI
ncbi:endothelin-converting enzyme 2-like isoform X1 [Lates japonicus]|uniref:Endothelin-converting enzyme 2-like isoform X1 n=1 Tax=Lates japonicus TaxID=270547 RepID=A0AAD3NEZ4_LATJO|nr:endothelin-converting enzyme 2-like isoform X1 [Lates japonicus]